METPQAPSPWRIIITDYTTFMVSLFAVCAWFVSGMLLVFAVTAGMRGLDPGRSQEGARLTLQIAVLATLFALIFIVLRVRWFRALYERGVVVPGEVAFAFFFRGRGSLTYRYTYLGETYKRSRSVTSVLRARGLRAGRKVVVVVDPEEPKQAVIRDLYI